MPHSQLLEEQKIFHYRLVTNNGLSTSEYLHENCNQKNNQNWLVNIYQVPGVRQLHLAHEDHHSFCSLLSSLAATAVPCTAPEVLTTSSRPAAITTRQPDLHSPAPRNRRVCGEREKRQRPSPAAWAATKEATASEGLSPFSETGYLLTPPSLYL